MNSRRPVWPSVTILYFSFPNTYHIEMFCRLSVWVCGRWWPWVVGLEGWMTESLEIRDYVSMYHQDLPECLQAYRRHAIQYGFHRWMDGYEWKTSCQLSNNLGKQNLSHLRKDRFGAAFPSSSSLPFAQSCPTLCDPMDSNLPGSAVHGIFQARILEWAAISFSRGSSQPRDRTRVSCIADRRFTIWANSLPKFSNF